MTSRKIDRRAFLSTGARAGITMCGLCACSQLPTIAFAGQGSEQAERIHPERLCYCGYSCPPDCKFLNGTIGNNPELKKEAWKLWKIEERFGVTFDPEQAICFGCKSIGAPEGIVLQRCDVRACAQDRELDGCIQCEKLTSCDRDLWRRFPDFKKQVIEMQRRYLRQA